MRLSKLKSHIVSVTGLLQKVSGYTWMAIHLIILVFLALFIRREETYYNITLEDSGTEYLTALFALLTAGFFLSNLKRKLPFITKSIFLAGSVCMIFFAGEEISWGQRIFNYTTPGHVADANDQHEFNLHNTSKLFFDRLPDRMTVVFVIFSSILLLRKIYSFLHVPLPHAALLLCFIITDYYRSFDEGIVDFYLLNYIGLMPVIIYSRKERSAKLRLMTFITILTTVMIPLVHISFKSHFGKSKNSASELREMTFSFCCFAYSLFIVIQYRLQPHRNDKL